MGHLFRYGEIIGTFIFVGAATRLYEIFPATKNKEIAELNQIPEGTVKSKLHHILKKLRTFAREKEDWL